MYQLVVDALVSHVEVWGYPVTNVSWDGHQADMLQNNCLKSNHPLRVPTSILNSVEIHQKSSDKLIPDTDIWYVISLGGQKKLLSPYLLPPTILFNTAIKMCARMLVHPILVDTKELIISDRDVIFGEIALTCYTGPKGFKTRGLHSSYLQMFLQVLDIFGWALCC